MARDIIKMHGATLIDFDVCQQNDNITKVVTYGIDLLFKVNNFKC